MKYQNKVNLFFLILAIVIFYGHELVYSVFYAYAETCPFYSQSDEKLKTKCAANVTYDILHKKTCRVCKSIHPSNFEAQLINYIFSTYSQLCESFLFHFCNKPLSRGPPTA